MSQNVDFEKRITIWLENTEKNLGWLREQKEKINRGPHKCEIIKQGNKSALSYTDGFFYYDYRHGVRWISV